MHGRTAPEASSSAIYDGAMSNVSDREISFEAFAAAFVAAKPIVIDVREEWEYEQGHVPGAVSIPLGQIPDRVSEFAAEDGEEVYVICQAGGRSLKAAEFLAQQGIDTISVAGGTSAWIEAGHEVEKPAGA